MILLYTLYGSLSYRLRGHEYFNLPQPLRRATCCVLPWVAIALSGDWKVGLGVGIVSYFGVITGHGRYYTLGRGPYPDRRDNWPGQVVSYCIANRYTWGFDAAALALTGLAFTAPLAAYWLHSGSYSAALCAVIAGVCKPIPYEIGWRLHGTNGRDPNAHNELYYGAWLGFWVGLSAAAAASI